MDEKPTPKVEVVIRFAHPYLMGLVIVLVFILALIGAVLIESVSR